MGRGQELGIRSWELGVGEQRTTDNGRPTAGRKPLPFHLLPLILLLLLLTGCGRLGLQPEPTPVPPTATAPPPTAPRATPTSEAPSPPTVAPSPAPPRLVMWTNERGSDLEVVRSLAGDFGAQAGIEIDVVPKSAGGLRADLIAIELVGDPPPDLIWGSQDDLAGLLVDEQLQPVELVDAPEAFVPAALVSATTAGQLWGQPVVLQDFLLLLHNRALVPQALRSTDQLIQQTRDIEGPDRYGVVAGWTEARWLLAWLNGFGGAPTTADGTRPTLNTPQMIRTLDLLIELHDADPPGQQSYTESSALFAAGQVAVAIDGDWALPNYRSAAPSLDIEVVSMPLVPATGRRAASAPGSTYLMFHRAAPEEQRALGQAFATYLVSPEVQRQIVRDMRRVPAVRAVLTDPVVTGDATLAAAAAQAEEALGLPPTKGLHCALRAINGQLLVLFSSEVDQQQIAATMQQAADACVAR